MLPVRRPQDDEWGWGGEWWGCKCWILKDLTGEMEGDARMLAREELADLLGLIGAREEGRLASGDSWRPEHVPADRWGQLFNRITGFALKVESWRATFKLSQNRPVQDRQRIADALEAEGSRAIAELMRGLSR